MIPASLDAAAPSLHQTRRLVGRVVGSICTERISSNSVSTVFEFQTQFPQLIAVRFFVSVPARVCYVLVGKNNFRQGHKKIRWFVR